MSQTKKQRSKKYYSEMIKDHQAIFYKMRKIINHILTDIIQNIEENPAPKLPENSLEIAGFQDGSKGYVIDNTFNSPDLKNSGKNDGFRFFSAKESISDVMGKIGRIALRMIPLEQEIAKLDLNAADLDDLHNLTEKIKERIPEEDMQIIEQYVERWNKENGYVKAETMEVTG